MVFDVTVAMTWLLFALFPIAFFWFPARLQDHLQAGLLEVALKRGETPKNVEKFAPYGASDQPRGRWRHRLRDHRRGTRCAGL